MKKEKDFIRTTCETEEDGLEDKPGLFFYAFLLMFVLFGVLWILMN